jgi:hypothetical protein
VVEFARFTFAMSLLTMFSMFGMSAGGQQVVQEFLRD